MQKGLFALIISLFVLTACSGTLGQTKEQAATLQDAHVGYQGVTLNFVANNPPDLTYTGSPLDVVVELRNQGAALAAGTLYLSGYDSRMFALQPRYQNFRLDAKTRFDSFGGYDTISFSTGSNPVYLPQGAETLSQTLQASACYLYQTQARIPVCINPNPNAVLQGQACDYKKAIATGVSGGQGAPVAVTAVREDAIPGQVGFQITIANQGTGQVVSVSSMQNCPATLGFNDVDVVQPYSVVLSGVAGDCKPVQKVRLANKQGTIYCTFRLSDSTSSAYQSILEVNLNYGYLVQQTKTITVKSLG